MSAYGWRTTILMLLAFLLLAAAGAQADELTAQVQKDLVALGYDPGTISGEFTTQTAVAISKYQAENDMPVTGEVSPLLAGVLSAAVDRQRSGGAATAESAAPPAMTPEELQAAQQACLQKKVAEAQAKQKKARGVGRLLSAVSRTASRAGSDSVAAGAQDVYLAGATADDLSAAAEDLGITEDDITACQNPTGQ